jgi:hypothetical protein
MIMNSLRKASTASLVAFLCGGAAAQPSLEVAPAAAGTDDIVVTAQRIGAPVWRVKSPTTTLVIIGSIPQITRDTPWNPQALERTMRGAAQVMYPTSIAVSASPFQALGWFAKYKRQATLPKGQSLTTMLSPSQLARLTALQQRGLVRRDFLQRHPLHLARELENGVEAKLKFGPSVTNEVERAVKAHKIRRVPIHRRKARPLVDELFKSPPQRHVACLDAAIALAEAGPATLTERSRHWAARRIPEALLSPANRVEASCWPADTEAVPTASEISSTATQVLTGSQVTVAVVPIRYLGGSVGVLQSLERAGYSITGPNWSR